MTDKWDTTNIYTYFNSQKVTTVDISEKVMTQLQELDSRSYRFRTRSVLLVSTLVLFILVTTVYAYNRINFYNSDGQVAWETTIFYETPVDIEDAKELYLQLRMLSLDEGSAVLGHYKADSYEDGFVLHYHKPIQSDSLNETIYLAGRVFNLKLLLDLIPEGHVFQSSKMRLDSSTPIEEMKDQLIVDSYKDDEPMHYMQYDPAPEIKQVTMKFSNLTIVLSTVDEDDSGFMISKEDEGYYEKIMLTNVEAMLLKDTVHWVQSSNGQLMNISVSGSSDNLIELCKSIDSNYKFEQTESMPIAAVTSYKTKVLKRQEDVYELRECLWEYISTDLDVPKGQGVLGHIKVPGLDVEIFADYLEPIFPESVDDVIVAVGDRYNIGSALSVIPSKYIFEKAVLMPGYKQQAAALEDELVEIAYEDDSLIHTVFYNLDYESVNTMVVYESGLMIGFGHLITNMEESTIAFASKFEPIQINDKEGKFTIISDPNKGPIPVNYIRWYQTDGVYYQTISISSSELTKLELLEIAERIESNYSIGF